MSINKHKMNKKQKKVFDFFKTKDNVPKTVSTEGDTLRQESQDTGADGAGVTGVIQPPARKHQRLNVSEAERREEAQNTRKKKI